MKKNRINEHFSKPEPLVMKNVLVLKAWYIQGESIDQINEVESIDKVSTLKSMT